MYGIDPVTLSSEYEISEVIQLARAANRFLAKRDRDPLAAVAKHIVPQQVQPKPQKQIPAGPDRAGFHEIYGSHYKTKLE